jgi:predicted ATP-grasp superfamily ATP-dependent carboligase
MDAVPPPASGPLSAHAPPLIVVGASVRAFAESARRSGCRVLAADLFGDVDTRRAADRVACVRSAAEPYPESLAAAIRDFPAAPWCYTGAIENHPDVIERIAASRPLLGCHAAAVRRVRDVDILARAVRTAGLSFPDTLHAPDGVPADGSHLVKPLASAGGRGIVAWTASTRAEWPRRGGERPHVWQRRIAGDAWAAAYAVAASGSRLLGASRQLTGVPWCRGRMHAYCGSIDMPLAAVPPAVRDQFERLAPILLAFGLAGVIGTDLVVDESGRAWVIEVNPRPTASMELIERATGGSIAGIHLAACGQRPFDPEAPPARTAGHWSKAVLYAAKPCAVTDATAAAFGEAGGRWCEQGWPGVGDIPAVGQAIPAGAPLCTIFALGETADDSLTLLRGRTAELARRIG